MEENGPSYNECTVNYCTTGWFKTGGEGVQLRCLKDVKELAAEGVSAVFVKAKCCDVIVKSRESSTIRLEFYGETSKIQLPYWKVQNKNGCINIETAGLSEAALLEKFTMVILVPSRLHMLDINAEIGKIFVLNGVSAEVIKLNTTTKEINCRGCFTQILAYSVSGGIEITTRAEADLRFNVSTETGYINLSLSNISMNDIDAKTKDGKVKKFFIPENSGYSAMGRIFSKKGKITIR